MSMAVAHNDDNLEPLAWSLGDRIRKARRVMGMEQAEFGAHFDVTEKAVSTWESDKNTPRNLLKFASKVEELARSVGKSVPAAWVLTGDSPGDYHYVHNDHATPLYGIDGGSRGHGTPPRTPLLTVCREPEK